MQTELGESVFVCPRLPDLEVFWRPSSVTGASSVRRSRIVRFLCKGDGEQIRVNFDETFKI